VPAAAVIPAPIAYIKVVAVKKLVVGNWTRPGGPPLGAYCSVVPRGHEAESPPRPRAQQCARGTGSYLEKIRVFKAGVSARID
jgi:hypothetical protein